jgi:hypothetical protein
VQSGVLVNFDHIEIVDPPMWAGTYTYVQGGNNSWSWYKGGDPQAEDQAGRIYPHFTVSSQPHESHPNGEWVGFHISQPYRRESGGIMNARMQFTISGNSVAYSNMSLAQFPASEKQGVRDDMDQYAQDYRTLGYNFYNRVVYEATQIGQN